jgi:hypothetical protein
MGDGRIFLKNLRDASFNKDLSNEPNFDRTIWLDSTFNIHEFICIISDSFRYGFNVQQ